MTLRGKLALEPDFRAIGRPVLAAVVCLCLMACSDRNPAGSAEEEPPAAAEETTSGNEDRASIIRPDIEIARTIAVEPLELTLDFADSGSELTAETVDALDALLESPQVTRFDGAITLRGHSDAGGEGAANMRMSQERADAIAAWLAENGIGEDRIVTIAFGEQNPVAPNALPDGTPDEAGRAANRRVEVTVAVPEGATIPAPAEPKPEPLEDTAVQSVTRQISGS